MMMVPLLLVGDMQRAMSFYHDLFGFVPAQPDASAAWPVVALHRGDTWMVLTSIGTDQKAAINVNVMVESVDDVYRTCVERKLDTSAFSHSPVHQQPVDQTWGTREFYVTDPDGNTLRFIQV